MSVSVNVPDAPPREDLHPVHFAREYAGVKQAFRENGIFSTLTVMGSARILPTADAAARLADAVASLEVSGPDGRADAGRAVEAAARQVANSRYYDLARDFSRTVSERGGALVPGARRNVIITGGGPSIMEAANMGAWEAGAPSAAVGVTFYREAVINRFVSPWLAFHSSCLAGRKRLMLVDSEAAVCFPGGLGSFDELLDTVALVQNGLLDIRAILLFGRAWWNRAIDLDFLVDEGMVSAGDLSVIRWADTVEEGWNELVASGVSLPS